MKPKPLLAIIVISLMVLTGAGYYGARYVAGGEDDSPRERCLIGPTPIPASEQSPVTAKDIQQGTDGKYFVPDRGDCCDFHEVVKLTLEGREWVLLGNPNCEVYWRYDPKTGEVVASPIMTPDKFPTPTPPAYEGPTPTAVPPGHFSTKPTPAMRPDPKDASLSADGKYSIPDEGDGCAWQETGRESIDGQLWVILESPQCRGQFSFAPATGDARLDLQPTQPTSTATPPTPPALYLENPQPSDFKTDPDGKYYVPDRGDGCAWTEEARRTQADGTLKIVLATQCAGNFRLWYFPETGKITLVVS